jgi:ankyrin repeat protein
MRDRGSISHRKAFSPRFRIAAAACLLLSLTPLTVRAQDLERFFTHPRLAEKSVGKTATDALELSQDQALWAALAFEDTEQLRQLLKRGANPNKPEELSLMTPLMAAETLSVAWTLLEAGADPRARDRTGKTVLHHAAKMREATSIVPLLVRAGADVNARTDDADRDTPIFCAVENYMESPDKYAAGLTVRTLVHSGADINAADANGATVLAIAASHNQPGLIKLLVELGADPNKRLSNGRTPLDYAREANATDAIQFLDGVASKSAPAN